jgi:hypothetical protein
MKTTGFAFLLTVIAVQGDVLSDFSPFLGSPNPDYDPGQLEPGTAVSDPSYAPFSPADSDFGTQQVLGETPERAPLRFFFNLDVNYTDNAPAAVRALEDGSFYVSTLIGASWQPHIANGWFADVGFFQEFYEFDKGDAIDFENMQPYVGVVKNLVDLDDTVFFARYEYQRLTTGSFSTSSYSAQRIRTGLQKSLFVTSRQQLAAGISAAFDIDANPEFLERNEYAGELSYTYWLSDALSATALWRCAYWDFDNAGRHDWNNLVGLELTYRFCTHASVYSSIYYSDNNSNSPFGANDFQSWQVGLGIGINYSF